MNLNDHDSKNDIQSFESGEDICIPLERESKNGVIVGSGLSEYDEHEVINFPIINTVNSNCQRMRRKDDIEIANLSIPRILEQKVGTNQDGNGSKRPRRKQNLSRVIVQDFINQFFPVDTGSSATSRQIFANHSSRGMSPGPEPPSRRISSQGSEERKVSGGSPKHMPPPQSSEGSGMSSFQNPQAKTKIRVKKSLFFKQSK